MKICDYCSSQVNDAEYSVELFGEVFHGPCYEAKVHDTYYHVRQMAQGIVEATQRNNSTANSLARKIIKLVGG